MYSFCRTYIRVTAEKLCIIIWKVQSLLHERADGNGHDKAAHLLILGPFGNMQLSMFGKNVRTQIPIGFRSLDS